MKSDGKKRSPLGLPSMKDRAMQALHTTALLPVVEMSVDWSSYGFRPEKGTADAIDNCLTSQWILE
jgi:RNA-directed DNA polymerase